MTAAKPKKIMKKIASMLLLIVLTSPVFAAEQSVEEMKQKFPSKETVSTNSMLWLQGLPPQTGGALSWSSEGVEILQKELYKRGFKTRVATLSEIVRIRRGEERSQFPFEFVYTANEILVYQFATEDGKPIYPQRLKITSNKLISGVGVRLIHQRVRE